MIKLSNVSKLLFLLIGSAIILSINLIAIPNFKTPYIYSPRQGGLGNAVTAIADDELLLLANPAGLGVQYKFIKTKPNESINYFEIISGGTINLASIHDLYGGYSGFDFSSLSVLNALQDYSRKPLSARTSVFTYSYLGKNFGFTFIPLYIDVQKITIVNDLLPSIYIKMVQTLQMSFGFNPGTIEFPNTKSRLTFGIAARLFQLVDIDSYAETRNINSISLDQLAIQEGVGIALDTGLLWEKIFAKNHKINLGLAVMDGPGVYFPVLNSLGFNSDGTIDFMQPNPKFGIAYFLPNYLDEYMVNTVFSFDYHRWIDPNQHWLTKIHLGIGTSIVKFDNLNLNVNVGLNGGYFTTSTIFYFYNVRFSYLLYQEELGYTPGANILYRNEFSFSLYF